MLSLQSIGKTATLALIFAMLAACSSRSVKTVAVDGSEVMTVNVDDVSDGQDVPISALAEDVEVIQLEAADDAFFNPWTVDMSEHHIAPQIRNRPHKMTQRSKR